MKAEWDRLRNKMVRDEDKVRERSDVAREAEKGKYKFYFGYLFGMFFEKNSEFFLLHPNGSLKGEWCFREIAPLANIGRLLSSKT